MHRTCESSVPFIRMSGNWLAEAGFERGCRISVEIATAAETALIIRKEKSDV
jgi:hypothetical protein